MLRLWISLVFLIGSSDTASVQTGQQDLQQTNSSIHNQTERFKLLTSMHFSEHIVYLHPTYESLMLQFRSIVNYGGARYHLSRGIADISEAQVTCSVYGGYLAEIKSNDELNAIRKFIFQDQLNLHAVFLGVDDRDWEGRWTYSYSKKRAFTKFHPGEPDGGINQGCVALHIAKDFHMVDVFCYGSYHFLCEIPLVD
ncbi:hypothetical protein Btru_049368 [Bulinus truncatus]|nr:hypothetical protein Btru_049368 [Bulinus truncatus]